MPLPEKYAQVVNRAALVAGGVGVPGSVFPPLDMAAMSVIWIKMTRDIARVSGHTVNVAFATKLIYSIGAGSLLYIGGSKLATALLHLIPGAGTTAAAGTNAAFNYVYTNRLGAMLVAQFDRPELDTASVLSMARTIATAVFVDVAASEVEEAQEAIDNADPTVIASAQLPDPEIGSADAGLSFQAPPDGAVPAADTEPSRDSEPKFGYTHSSVSYDSTSGMVRGHGYDSSGRPVNALGFPR